jgi:citrate-Mg2+:H+ or citrate-Ca2+:H+ symporter, CitMHS family
MLALIGGITILLLLVAVMSGRVAPIAALIVLPVIAAIVGGHAAEMGTYIVRGIENIAPVTGMTVFAILFFGIVTDAGLFEPLIRGMLRLAGSDPTRVVMATSVLASIIHLDGAGAVTFLVTVTAFLPIYERLGIDRRVLACTVAVAAGVANMLPWGGPTLRAASALNIPVMDLYWPLAPIQLVGFACALFIAYVLGRREALRLAGVKVVTAEPPPVELRDTLDSLRRPRLFWFNAVLTVAVVAAMLVNLVPPVVPFMLGTVIALLANYPSLVEQRDRIDAHARPAMMMATVLFAAGVYTGIMKEAGFLGALADSMVVLLSPEIAAHIPVVLGVVAMPLSLLFDPDSFYFGILPVFAQAAAHFDVPGAQVAQAALLGQMTTGFPVSPLTPATYLLVGLARIELGAHQRFTIPYLFLTSLVMTAACVLLGLFPL